MFSITPTAGLLLTFTSTLLINRISSSLANVQFIYPRNILESNEPYHYWRYRNFLISFFHAFLTGFGSLFIVLNNPTLLWEVIDLQSKCGYILSAFSLGYFIYDTIDMMSYKEKKGTTELLLHHFFVMSCFFQTVLFNRFIGYNMIALLVELSNIFLHFRQLLLLSNHSKSSRLYQINSITNIVLFVIIRGLAMFWLWYTLITFFDRLPLITKVSGVMAMSGITVTTIILFKRLLDSDFIQSKQRRSTSSAKLHSSGDDHFIFEGKTIR